MTDEINRQDDDLENEQFPIEPRYHPVHRLTRAVYDFLASARLAMALLVIILACSVAGVTILRGQRAWELIFSSLWFNAILVMLVVNVACCFFGRVWGRRVTIVSFGMILFHLSFVAMFLGIVYNSLFYFRGSIRLSEGETLPNADPQSYDVVDKGRFFSFSRLKGETTLIRMYRDYKVSGEDKRAAYEVAIGDAGARKQGIVYITHNLDYRGFTYFPDREGYSVLVVLSERQGRDLYGAVVPLQSIHQPDDSYQYVTGTREGVAGLVFPQGEMKPLYDLQLNYIPSKLDYRGGDVDFELRRLPGDDKKRVNKPFAKGRVAIGRKFAAEEHDLAVKEVLYWVAMKVAYEPGKPVVLTSLWVGLAGMVITTIGRMFRRRR